MNVLTKGDMAKRIITRRVTLTVQQSHSDDIYDETVALRSAIILALQREGKSKFGLKFIDKHVPVGERLTPDSVSVIENIEDALINNSASTLGYVLMRELGL